MRFVKTLVDHQVFSYSIPDKGIPGRDPRTVSIFIFIKPLIFVSMAVNSSRDKDASVLIILLVISVMNACPVGLVNNVTIHLECVLLMMTILIALVNGFSI